MKIDISNDYQDLCNKVANEVIELIKHKNDAVLCFPSGDTPLGVFQALVENQNLQKSDFSKCKFIGLDEWVGLDINDEGSCQNFIYNNLFNPLKINQNNITFFDAKKSDLLNECKRIDHVISELGGIDLIILGIGMNGHVGFNEPGCDPDLLSLVVDLDEISLLVGKKYFSHQIVPKKGISLGLKQIMATRKVILMANGEKKADIIQKVVETDISIQIPASLIRKHNHSFLFIDKAASRKITSNRL